MISGRGCMKMARGGMISQDNRQGVHDILGKMGRGCMIS